jgi:hypothetical protein
MRPLLPALAALLAVALLIGACDDDEGPATSPTPEATATAEAQATADAANDDSTATAEAAQETPEAEPSPEATAIEATEDVDDLLNKYADATIRETDCDYDVASAGVDCGELGLYTLAPNPSGTDVVCDVLTVDDEPIAVSCTSQAPLTVIYYPIPQE